MPYVVGRLPLDWRSGFVSGFTVARGSGLTDHIAPLNLSCQGGWTFAVGLQGRPVQGPTLHRVLKAPRCPMQPHFSWVSPSFQPPLSAPSFLCVRSCQTPGARYWPSWLTVGSLLPSQLARVLGQPVPTVPGENSGPLGARPARPAPLHGTIPSRKGLQEAA